MTQKPRQSNQPSILLQRDENDILFQLTGPKCVVLASAVVQVFLAEAPSHKRWCKKHVGVATFIKDNGKRSYYIRVYDIEAHALLWEQELYNMFEYNVLKSFFHSFNADSCPAGLNFASDEESDGFKKAVKEYLNKREKRRSDRAPGHTNDVTHSNYNIKPMMINQPPTSINASFNGDSKKPKSKRSKKVKLDKKDIGNPSDFRHVNHVGWDPDKGFDTNNLNPDMKDLFSKVGLTDDQLKDKDTAEFVRSFLAKWKPAEVKRPSPSIPSVPPTPSNTSHFVPTPPPPMRQTSQSHPPPPPPVPTPNRPNLPKPPGPPPREPSLAPPMSQPPPPPPAPHRAPPMAPPPPSGVPPPPAPPPPPPPAPTLPHAKPASLLDEIHKGRDLHHVEPEAPAPVDGRNALLSDIREGIALKAVSKTEGGARKEEPVEDDTLVGALMKALNDRAKSLRSDEDDGDTDDDEDEWDD